MRRPSIRCVWRGVVLWSLHLAVCSWRGHVVNPAYPVECFRCWAMKQIDGRWR